MFLLFLQGGGAVLSAPPTPILQWLGLIGVWGVIAGGLVAAFVPGFRDKLMQYRGDAITALETETKSLRDQLCDNRAVLSDTKEDLSTTRVTLREHEMVQRESVKRLTILEAKVPRLEDMIRDKDVEIRVLRGRVADLERTLSSSNAAMAERDELIATLHLHIADVERERDVLRALLLTHGLQADVSATTTTTATAATTAATVTTTTTTATTTDAPEGGVS